MRSKVVRMLALALVVGGVSIVVGQQPGSGDKTGGPPFPGVAKKDEKDDKSNTHADKKAAPAKSKLEEMLAEALKNNPDIRVAAAKLAEADAELNRTRLQVMQKVVTLYHAIDVQKKIIASQEVKYKRMERANKSGAVSIEDMTETEQALALAKGKLEELEAQLPALLGKSPQAEYAQTIQQARLLRQEAVRSALKTRRAMIEEAEWENAHKAIGAMAERLRKALQTPVTVDYKNMTLDAILNELAHTVAGASFRVVNVINNPDRKINLWFKEALPLSAVLQALADEYQCCFFVREYGILASDPNLAPPGAMKVEEFLRQKPADEPHRQSSSGKNPPMESVEGFIKSVDKDGLLTISIGSDAGLAKGQTLELYWMPHKAPINDARSFGTVRIVEVEAHQAVAQPVGGLRRKPQPSDRIIGQTQKK